MVKPVDCVFFFTEHPQLTVSCCTVGAFGVCIPAVALSFDPGLKAPGYVSNPHPELGWENQVCLKIPFLFALCFFWRLRVVFKHFFTNVRVGNTAFNGKLQSPLLLCFQELGLEGKRACSRVRSSTRAGFAGWDGAALVLSDERRAAHCPHSPLQVGT